MREGPRSVARASGRRLAALLAVTALVALAGDPDGAGVAGGALAAIAIIAHALVFGVARSAGASPPSVLRAATVWGVALAAGAGVFAAAGAAFGFIVIDLARAPVSVGGALMQAAAFIVTAGAGGLVYQCLAARSDAAETMR